MKRPDANCDKFHQLLLLEESGELTQDRRRELEIHLNECSDCANYRREITTILNLGRKSLPGGLPSVQAINNILARAGEPGGEIVFFAHPWRIAAGIAAVLAVILGVFFTVTTPSGPSGNAGFAAGDLNVVLSLADEDGTETPTAGQAGSEEAQLKELAGRLLKMQGFSIEETEEPEDVIDLFLPTALQSHNIPASQAETSV